MIGGLLVTDDQEITSYVEKGKLNVRGSQITIGRGREKEQSPDLG